MMEQLTRKCLAANAANTVLSRWAAILVALLMGLAHPALAAPANDNFSDATTAHIVEAFDKTPLFFERNEGQFDEQAKFMARGAGYGLFLTATESVLSLRKANRSLEKRVPGMAAPLAVQGPPVQPVSAVLRMQLVAAIAKRTSRVWRNCRARATTSSATINRSGARMSSTSPK